MLLLFPLPEKLKTQPSKVVLFEDRSLARAYLSSDQKWRFPIEVKSLPGWIKESILCIEDKRFYSHVGVDPLSLSRAIRQNLGHGRIVSGGSTITMQLARLLEPKERTIISKLIEIFRAIQFELRFSKEQILEYYLNFAPYGGNIEGLDTAAYKYFLKPVELLNPLELSFLTLLPQSPNRIDRLKKDKITELSYRNLQRFHQCKTVSDADLMKYIKEKLVINRQPLDFYAYHWSDDLIKRYSKQSFIISSLKSNYQKSIEALVKSRQDLLKQEYVNNISLVVLENKTGKFRTVIGNFDYFSKEQSQSIAGYSTFRSTGSLLKPFFMANLISNGEVLLETLLEDVPFELENYNPKNYDGKFSGLVEAQWALAHSLNVPWIKKLSQVGIDSFTNFLFSTNVKTNLKPDQLGLSMIIGGLQLTLMDLTRLYSSFPNQGRLMDIKDNEADQTSSNSWLWFHPGSAELVGRALGLRGRPDFGIDSKYVLNSSDIKWKTGTSQGRRDAWSIGYNKEFTVGVWLGNLTNEAAPALVGSDLAAPLMFDTFAILNSKSFHFNGQNNENLQEVEVCSFSGLPPGPSCKHRKKVFAPLGVVIKHRCPYHQEYLYDSLSGFRLNQDCSVKNAKAKLGSFINLPEDVLFWTKENNQTIQTRPPMHPRCLVTYKEKGSLKILEPQAKNYILFQSMGTELVLPLKIKSSELSSNIKCFINGKIIKNHESSFGIILSVKPGDYELFCVSKSGHSDQVSFSVEK